MKMKLEDREQTEDRSGRVNGWMAPEGGRSGKRVSYLVTWLVRPLKGKPGRRLSVSRSAGSVCRAGRSVGLPSSLHRLLHSVLDDLFR